MLRLLVFTIVLSPASVLAWECIEDRCPTVCEPPLRYQIGEVPPGLDEAMVVSEVQRAFALWEAVDCASIRFEYTGREGEGGTGVVIAWTEAWSGDASQWATPGVAWDAGLCIQEEGLTRFEGNARDFEWGFSPAAGSMVLDVYTVMLKAAGNFMGLGNSSDRTAVMSSFASGETRSAGLAADDIDGACTLYGDGMRPDAGVGSGASCTPCSANDECDSNLCVGFPDGTLCGARCETSDDCETGAECITTADISVCARMVETAPTCAPNAMAGGDSGVDRDAGASDGGTDASMGGGGGGCSTTSGSGGSLVVFAALLFIRRRRS